MIMPQECYVCKFYKTLNPEECSKYCESCAINKNALLEKNGGKKK